jgi:hypothetical protein
MRTILFLSLAVISLSACRQTATPDAIQLKFKDDGSFRIAQFTDLHFVDGSPGSATTEATIRYVLETEKPDVAILTGDQAIDVPSANVWPVLARIFEETQTPFAVVFGNHDAETITKDSALLLLEASSFFIGKRGPDDIHGMGNYVLEIEGRTSGRPATILYCLDSNDYTRNDAYGYYDWIHYDQIEWYRQQSRKYTQENNNQPLPALAFFHIPLQEYEKVATDKNRIGTKGENIAPSEINPGMFASFVEMKDVQGVFVGHDHNNDYIGITTGIALAFGRVGGTDAYGYLERGARMIELNEDRPRSFTTWIRVPSGVEHRFYYPSGLTEDQEKNSVYLPAQSVDPATNGVAYRYYEGKFQSVDEIPQAAVVQNGTLPNFSIREAAAEDGFAYEFRTLIRIPERGVYRFHLFSDDGSRLYVDGQMAVDNDGSHGEERTTGDVALEAGFHDLKVLYFEDYMGQTLEVGLSTKNTAEALIPTEWLYLPE